MTKYVAFLRGINIGGKTILMKDLIDLFEQIGFTNVTSVLASGNILFESEETNEAKLVIKIEQAIIERFSFAVKVQVTKFETIQQLVMQNPFKNLTPNKDTHWYVTFLNNNQGNLPENTNSGYTFLTIQDGILFSILDKKSAKSTDFMAFLDKTFGKAVTTRNWNTLERISKLY